MGHEQSTRELQFCDWNEDTGEAFFGRAKVELIALESGGFRLKSFKALPSSSQSFDPSQPLLHAGFFDSHLHTFWLGEFLQSVVGGDYKSCEGYFSALRKLQAARPSVTPSFPLKSFAMDESRWGLSLEKLRDQAAEALGDKNPWILYRVCGHCAIVSESVAQLIDPASCGSQVFEDSQLFRLSDLLEQRSPEEELVHLKKCFLIAQEYLLAHGINAVGDMSLEGPMLQALQKLAEEDKLWIHHQGVLLDGAGTQSTVPYSISAKFLEQELLRECQHWKRYLDGSLGSKSAALLNPYLEEPGKDKEKNYGSLHYKDEELFEASSRALERGFALSFHAIGDAAIEQILRLSENLKEALQKRADLAAFPVHRIEHAQVMSSSQLERLKKDFPFWTLAVQPLHEREDLHFAESYLGQERRVRDMYRLRSFMDASLPVSIGSDAPVVSVSPEETLKACQNFQNSDERISLEKALELYLFAGRKAHRMPIESLNEGKRVFIFEAIEWADQEA